MLDRKLLELAGKMGHDCYLEQHDIKKSIPWPDTEEYKPYIDQMKASYDEAKQLFENDTKTKK